MREDSKLGVSRRCWAEVDLAALERNVEKIRRGLSDETKYIAVVKADAYGHGLTYIARKLMAINVDYFAVATVQEGAAIRELGENCSILVMSAILPGEEYAVVEYGLMPTISTEGEIKRFDDLGRRFNKKIDVHLKIDTGMGRSGVWHDEAGEVFKKIIRAPWLELAGIYTHFPAADTDIEFTSEQKTLFVNLLKGFKGKDLSNLIIHADSSAGLGTFIKGSVFNGVRPGLIQYGVAPWDVLGLGNFGVEPIMSLKARVGLIKELPKGVGISYGRTYRLKKQSRTAIVTAGYGDGVPMGLSNCGEVIIRGNRVPILGIVTMDQLVVDVTDMSEVDIGDEVVLIGSDGDESISMSEWSKFTGRIEWDLYCSITKRVPRKYI